MIFRCNCLIGFNTILKWITSTFVMYNSEVYYLKFTKSFSFIILNFFVFQLVYVAICLAQTILTLVNHKVVHNLLYICNELFLILSVWFLIFCNTCPTFFSFKITKALIHTDTISKATSDYQVYLLLRFHTQIVVAIKKTDDQKSKKLINAAIIIIILRDCQKYNQRFANKFLYSQVQKYRFQYCPYEKLQQQEQN